MTSPAVIDRKTAILQTITEQGILPLYFNKEESVSISVLKALYDAGIRAVEYTNRGEAAVQNFKALRRLCDTELKGLQLGIGTIKTADDAKAFVDEGADYLISPGVVKAAAKVADKAGLLYVPGCMTPTEIIKAEALGATFVKLFPGDLLGPKYIKAVQPLFPKIQFMVTGGVEPDKENLQSWFDAGVVAVGMGSKLITKSILESGDYAKITELTKASLQLVQDIRR